MIKRSIHINTKIGCCLDDVVLVPLDNYRPFYQEEIKHSFETTLEEWKAINEDIAETVITYEATIYKCRAMSSSFYACGYEGIVVSLTEIPVIIVPPVISVPELEEMIYDMYLKRYRVRIIPSHVTDAIAYMHEHGSIITESKDTRRLPLERYCFGNWCFDTMAHTNTFERKHPRIVRILEELQDVTQ